MFDKITTHYDHIHFTPDRFAKKLPLLVMSHGSGGISDIDTDFAKIACANGYQVIIVDHFTKRGVKSQIWHDVDNIYPTFDDRATDIYNISAKYNANKKLLFGISAGGTACLICSADFDKTFLAYPALVGITEPMLEAHKVTIVTGKDDDWTPVVQACRYVEYVDAELHIVDGFHGFLNPREDRFLENVISLKGIELPIPFQGTLEKINYQKGVTTKYNKESRLLTENLFTLWLS
jgi:dienelactone hydrolase|tara:strand:+ start:1816 stop:2520 length:705 start_codon:yes stop_codon:yes gene_type:complete